MPNAAPAAAASAKPICGERGKQCLAARVQGQCCFTTSVPVPPGLLSAWRTPDLSLSLLLLTTRPGQVNNNFGGGFVSDEDRVALSAIKFASGESAGAKCISSDDGNGDRWLEASMEQLCVPLPPWGLRAGARETIWFNPAEVNAASECANGRWCGLD